MAIRYRLGRLFKTKPFPVIIAVGRQVIPIVPFHKWLACTHPDIAMRYPCPTQTPRAVYEKTSFSIPEVRKLLGIGKTSAYELAKEPIFDVLRVEKYFRITRASFDQWLHSQDELFNYLQDTPLNQEDTTPWHLS